MTSLGSADEGEVGADGIGADLTGLDHAVPLIRQPAGLAGGFGVALSALAIVLLVRLSPARALRRAATSA